MKTGIFFTAGIRQFWLDGDTVYCYVGHDTSSNESYWMPDWRCYSSKDMKNWTYESKIMNSSDIKGGNNHEAWAGQVAKGSDGKYYFYYCTQFSDGKGVGVGVSDSPTGPFKDVNQKPLVSNSQTATAYIHGKTSTRRYGSKPMKMVSNTDILDGEIQDSSYVN